MESEPASEERNRNHLSSRQKPSLPLEHPNKIKNVQPIPSPTKTLPPHISEGKGPHPHIPNGKRGARGEKFKQSTQKGPTLQFHQSVAPLCGVTETTRNDHGRERKSVRVATRGCVVFLVQAPPHKEEKRKEEERTGEFIGVGVAVRELRGS